jgi:hypothetical protein
MNWTRTNAAAGLILLSACGQQAGEDYRGEPLMHLSGQVVVSALTGGQAIAPALCFFMADQPIAPAFDGKQFPADIRAELTLRSEPPYPDQFIVEALNKRATHILDVESRGKFPAQFDVDVYLPPPSDGLSAPAVAGESRWAQGFVCAVAADHRAVTFPLAFGGLSDSPTGAFRYAIASLETPRYYYERYECATGTLPQAMTGCKKTTSGDSTLAFEFQSQGLQSESVLGVASEYQVLYLEHAAPAGSYTAYQWGAAKGLSAGYHLFPPGMPATNPDGSPANWMCQNAALTEAEKLNNEQFGARIKQLFGNDYIYNGGSAYSGVAGAFKDLPEDLRLATRENEARLLMKHCPLEPRAEIDPSAASLSIDIKSDATPDLSKNFGFAGPSGMF